MREIGERKLSPETRTTSSTSATSPTRGRGNRRRNSSSGRTSISLRNPDFLAVDDDDYYNPRSFPQEVKQQCWEKADKIKNRDPDRWRRDPLGNIVFRKLVGCPGCLCHDYDHIVPFSKGGKSTLENCQVLQATANRRKGNKTEISKADLIQKSAYCRVSGRDMDLLELTAYGNVRRGQDSGWCSIQ